MMEECKQAEAPRVGIVPVLQALSRVCGFPKPIKDGPIRSARKHLVRQQVSLKLIASNIITYKKLGQVVGALPRLLEPEFEPYTPPLSTS
ncbi:hypothetical protein VNO77_03342 [Canavalia gladiata]|uniref:Uncharacterized protein n=1 Tax=Canavalia gladiata TaxID=3824 RepID=A0AAN9R6R5_CANGL